MDGAEAEVELESGPAVVEPAEVEEGVVVVPPGAGVEEEDPSGVGVEDGEAEVLDDESSDDVVSEGVELEVWEGDVGVEDEDGVAFSELEEPVKPFRVSERESARRINALW